MKTLLIAVCSYILFTAWMLTILSHLLDRAGLETWPTAGRF